MLGLMQRQPLLISSLIDFAARHHGDGEIVSRRVEGDVHRYTWKDVRQRSMQVAHALEKGGISTGQRVATLAWNGYRHLELYYGVSGSGRVLHTINPRLHPEQVAWIVSHAEDQVLAFDTSFLPMVQSIAGKCPGVRLWIALCEKDQLPVDSGIPGLLSYEDWIDGHLAAYPWPDLDENVASSLCYRSTLLHAYAAAWPDVMNLSARDSVLPVVPMFHVNAWGIPYSAALVGCKLVFPGPALDGKSVYELLEAEQVSFAAGVPTVWQMLLGYVEANGFKLNHLRRTIIGGSACPPSMMDAFMPGA
jgi:acyl-CoA synthetase (AMP-forming)/AMP-acid ligase II